MLSNIVSAAMYCCNDMDTQHVDQQTAEMPCHDMAVDYDDDHHNQDTDKQHQQQCECQGCFQLSNIPDQSHLSHIPFTSFQMIDFSFFLSSDPDVIYHPPKSIS